MARKKVEQPCQTETQIPVESPSVLPETNSLFVAGLKLLPPTPSPLWEYHVEWIDHTRLSDRLNELGHEGWHLVLMIREKICYPEGKIASGCELVFERKKGEVT